MMMMQNPNNAAAARGLPQLSTMITHPHLHKPSTTFHPGTRLLVNAIPMFLNVALPWAMFTLTFAATSFYLMYRYPTWVSLLLGAELCVCVVLVIVAVRERNSDQNPTWYGYSAIVMWAALISGALLGRWNFEHYTKKFYEIQDLKVIGSLDPSKELGRNVLDAGVVYFSSGSEVDGGRSWHFKHDTLYCVAPITSGTAPAPDTGSVDFWAVGTDCCSEGSSDFRCGDFSDVTARGGVRVLDEKSLPFFQLAVKQAESLFDVAASNPVFFHWSKDPVTDIALWHKEGLMRFLYSIAVAFIVALTTMLLMMCQFSLLGRQPTAYAYGAKMAYDAVNYEAGGTMNNLHERYGPRYGIL